MEENIENPQIEEKVETPPVEKVETPEQPSFEDMVRQKFGLAPEELQQQLEVAQSYKDKVVLDDPELVPDEDFLKDLIRHRKRGGNVEEYLAAKAVDYTKMTAEEVIKHKLRKDNPGLPEKFINRKFEAFKSSAVADMEEDEAQEYLNFEADQIRKNLIDEQSKFKIPERKVEEPSFDAKSVEEFERKILNDPFVKGLKEAKKVSFGDFNFEVNPDDLVESALSGTWLNQFFTEQGPDMERLLKVTAIAQNLEEFLRTRDAHIASQVEARLRKELVNPSDPTPAPTPAGEVTVRVRRPGD